MKIAVIALMTSASLFAVDRTMMLPVSLSEQFVFEPDGLVEVRGNFSDLVVEGWDQPDIEVTVTRRDSGVCCVSAPEEGVGYDARKKQKDHFVISAEESLPGPSRYRIRVPKHVRLVIREPQQRLAITGVKGEVQVSVLQGRKLARRGCRVPTDI